MICVPTVATEDFYDYIQTEVAVRRSSEMFLGETSSEGVPRSSCSEKFLDVTRMSMSTAFFPLQLSSGILGL